jgi:hypothetical protein
MFPTVSLNHDPLFHCDQNTALSLPNLPKLNNVRVVELSKDLRLRLKYSIFGLRELSLYDDLSNVKFNLP